MSRKEPTENVTITVPESLLHFLDMCCHKRDLNRSQAVCRALRQYLAVEKSKDPDFWAQIYNIVDE